MATISTRLYDDYGDDEDYGGDDYGDDDVDDDVDVDGDTTMATISTRWLSHFCYW